MERNIKELSIRYVSQCAAMALILHILVVGIANLLDYDSEVWGPSAVSAVFCVAVGCLIGYVWRKVAENHKDMLPVFYSATHGFRMLLGLATLTACYFIVGRDAMTVYVLVFMGYYLIFLAHHAIYFSRITNYNVIK